MAQYLIKRVFYMILVLWLLTIVSFIIIQLPPGDIVSSMARRMAQTGDVADQAMMDALREQWGLD